MAKTILIFFALCASCFAQTRALVVTPSTQALVWPTTGTLALGGSLTISAGTFSGAHTGNGSALTALTAANLSNTTVNLNWSGFSTTQAALIAPKIVATPTTTPGSPVEGWIYDQSSSHHLFYHNGTSFKQIDLTAATDYLAPNGSGAALTALNATELTSGTIADARFAAYTTMNTVEVTTITADANLTSAANFISEGANQIGNAGSGVSFSRIRHGTATLSAGVATVSDAYVSSNSRIIVTAQSLGTVTVPTALAVTARTASTSFVITSANVIDTSIVAWEMIEP